MRRWPVAAFVALAVATVGAFFVVQHLKVTTPLINGFPAPVPATIDPLAGGICPIRNGRGRMHPVSFRRTSVSFYLQNRADVVDVYVLDSDLERVRQIGFAVPMRIKVRHEFTWDGRLRDGAVAPDGLYYLQVSLVHQNRAFLVSNQSTGVAEPVTVLAHPVPLRVTAVSPATLAAPGTGRVTIRYSGGGGVRPRILIYRLPVAGPPVLVKRYSATSRAGTSVWDGRLRGGAPAPPGTYLVGLSELTRACTVVRSPVSRGTAPQAVVTVG